MTELLRKAFEAAAKLSPEEQDALATLLLDELQAREHWDASLARSRGTLGKLADEALKDHRAGRTRPLDPEAL